VPDSVFGAAPTCGAGTTATVNLDSSGRYVGANYCPRTFNQLTYRVGADYQITPRNLVYATVSSGFRSGGFNAGQLQAANAPTFEPEKVTAFEIGSKNRFFGNTLQFNLSAFYNRYSDLQEPRPINIGSTVISVTFNAATARAYGLEAEAIWQPTQALTIGANASLLDARYSSFTSVPLPYGASIIVSDPTATAPTVVNGITIANIGEKRVFAPGYSCAPLAGTGGAGQPALSFGCNLSGNNIPHSPRYSGSAYASYAFDLGDMGTLTPLAALTFSAGYDEQSFNDRLGKSPGYAKLDLTLTWKYNNRFSLEAYGTNVTSTLVRTIVSYGGTPLQASYEPPAQYGVRLSAKY
jgi:iron complex outermembrane recepter protein